MKNKIKSLTISDGVLLQRHDTIIGEILMFYQNLLSSAAHYLPATNPLVMRERTSFDRQYQMSLIELITGKEVTLALKNIDDCKAPDCDGYNSYFFKKAWGRIYTQYLCGIILVHTFF